MKTHGPNSPQTIRGLLNRRSQRGLLDTRWQQEADITTEPMVGPFGKGFHTLTTPSGTSFVVGDASGQTWAPGAEVMVANPGGLGQRAVLGHPPPGKKSGATRTRSARRRGVVQVTTNQYAFGDDGVDLWAMLYADGTYISTRDTIAIFGGTHSGCILSDSSETVGDGSLLMRGSADLYVWDVEGAASYSYSVPSGWLLLTEAYYQNGKLYWIEGEDFPDFVTTEFDIRLRSADTDLTNVATVQTVNRDIADAQTELGGSTIEYFTYAGGVPDIAAGIMVDEDGAVVYFSCRPQDGNGERTDYWRTQFRFAVAGGAPASRAWTEPEGTALQAVTLGDSAFAFSIVRADLGFISSVMGKSDDATAAASDLWGSSDLALYGVTSISVGTGGAMVQVHWTGGAILRGVSDAGLVVDSIDLFDGVNAPASMFYFGE